MRISLFLFCATLFGLTPKHSLSQNDKIEIYENRTISIDEIFEIISEQTDYTLVYPGNLFDDFPKVNLRKGVIQLKKLLDKSLPSEKIDVQYKSNNTIVIKAKTEKRQVEQQRQVSGTVNDESGFPVPGATVLVKGTNRGTAADFNGKYTITVSGPTNVLVFSSLGFKEEEIRVGNQTVIDVVLKEDVNQLKEVILQHNYYETTKKKETSAIARITSKTIEKQPVNNPLAAMQGHLPGVDIVPRSGAPGTGFTIRIRGTNFIDASGQFGTDNEPLYVVDGVPYSNRSLENGSTLSPNIIPGGNVSPLNTINPGDIESIEVLKDADATAIYGSLGANGVVLITTKKGRIGKTQVKVNLSTTMSRVSGFADVFNTEQHLEVIREALTNDGFDLSGDVPRFVTERFPELFTWDQNRYTDWQDVLFGETGFRQNAQVSISGGNEQTQYLLSGGYSRETNVFPGDTRYIKGTAGLNVNHRSEDNRFRMNASVDYGIDDNNLPASDFTRQALRLAPNAPALYDEEGNLNWENSTWNNPLAQLKREYLASTHSLITNILLSFRPMPSLELKTNLGYTDYRIESYSTTPNTAFDPNTNRGMSSRFSTIVKNNGSRQSVIVEPQINWQHEWEVVKLKVLLGTTFQSNQEEQFSLRATGFPSNALIFNLAAAETRLVQIDTNSEYRYHAVFGRINLDIRDRYIFNLTGRRDGSSRFGPGRQFGNFGAVGVAWLFSEERFLEDRPFLSFGKLRASYGITGGDTSPNYAFYDSYGVFGNFNGAGLRPVRLFNPDFGWEETKKLEAALELGFLENRISLSAAWYRNRSSNQLINVSLPSTTGFTGVNANLDALVQNMGVEVDLQTVNVKTGAFKWSSSFNIAVNRNKLLAFPGLERSTFRRSFVIGQPLGIARLYRSLGVDPETGIYQFEDYNNDGQLDFDNDAQFLEDLTPDFLGGLGNSVQYKNFQLDVFFQFKKQKARRHDIATFVAPGVGNNSVSQLDRWQRPGDIRPIQRYSIYDNNVLQRRNFYSNSDAAITDASFVRLRNISLNYTVPKTMFKGLDLNIYLQGQNLFVITGYDGPDPEGSFSFIPPLRQFTLGANIGF